MGNVRTVALRGSGIGKAFTCIIGSSLRARNSANRRRCMGTVLLCWHTVVFFRRVAIGDRKGMLTSISVVVVKSAKRDSVLSERISSLDPVLRRKRPFYTMN